jgi:hypothetical protein
MRKHHLIWALGAALALAVIGAGIASAAPNTQSITGKITPSKLPKSGKGAAVKLFTDVSSSNAGNPSQIPNPTTLALVDFDKDLKFQSKGLATCNFTSFTAATTTAQASGACAPSREGGGSAKIEVPTGASTPPINVSAVVTAFNGKASQCRSSSPPPQLTASQTKFGCIILFSYNSLSGAQTLVGGIGKSTGGGKYGTTLTVVVPPLAGGSAVIQEFNTTVKKTYHSGGKKLSVVNATCKDKKLNFQARFTDNVGQTATGTSTQTCKQKG